MSKSLEEGKGWSDAVENSTEWDSKTKNPQEQCSYCAEFYPVPVSLHHTTEECDVNIKLIKEPSDGDKAAREQ